MRQGFALAEIRAMSVDEAEAFVEILYPQAQRRGTPRVQSLRQNWRKWKRP